jgi:hypothetical protein
MSIILSDLGTKTRDRETEEVCLTMYQVLICDLPTLCRALHSSPELDFHPRNYNRSHDPTIRRGPDETVNPIQDAAVFL